jgi:hypothetical protein
VRGSCLITAFSVLLVVLSTQLSYADSLPKRLYLSNNPSGGPYSIVAVDLTTNTEVTPAIPVTAEPGAEQYHHKLHCRRGRLSRL